MTPVIANWTDYFENGPFLTEDFDVGREDWVFEEREPLE
jgi:hypothetical protein